MESWEVLRFAADDFRVINTCEQNSMIDTLQRYCQRYTLFQNLSYGSEDKQKRPNGLFDFFCVFLLWTTFDHQ